MAFATKYRSEFNDILGLTWKVDIQEDAYGGSITTLKATDSPLTIEFDGGDEFNAVIRPSKAKLTVWSMTDFALADLYSDEDFHYKVNIYYDDNIYWTGYIVTGEYTEPYDMTPYPVTITAVDGLNYLKTYLYKYQTTDPDDTYYNGRTLESQVILDVLSKIGVTSFREYINIYEESMTSTAGASPLDQVKLDVDVFKDMYCDEVLTEILKKYNACIRQKDGNIILYRPTELTGETVYGRIFTDATTKSATTFTPAQSINRTAAQSDLVQLRGPLMVKRPAKKIKILQDYGYKASWIDNYNFEASSYNSATSKYDNWTYYGGTGHVAIWNMGYLGESQGLGLVHASGTPNAYNVSQSFGAYAVKTNDMFVFEFDYKLLNPLQSTPADVTIYIRIKHDTSGNYLKKTNGEYLSWTTSASYISFTETANPGFSEWKKFTRSFVGLPGSGSYTISIHAPTSTYVYCGYKNIRFFSTSNSISLKKIPWHKQSKFKKTIDNIFSLGTHKNVKIRVPYYNDLQEVVAKEITIANALNGIEISEEYKLGDVSDTNITNVIEQFQGSLAVAAAIGYTGSTDKIDTVTVRADGSGTGTFAAGGVSRPIPWNTDPATTISDFITAQAEFYTNLTLYQTAANTFTITGSWNFDSATISASIGTAAVTQSFIAGTPVMGILSSGDWNTRGGSESDPLLQLIGEETGVQYSRPKQLIQLSIQEKSTDAPALNILGNLQDSLNTIGGNARLFVFNRGDLDVKFRKWNADFLEIIT